MSMRSSKVCGGAGGFHWHGWEQLDEGDAFYLDVSGPKDSCGVGGDPGPMTDSSGFRVRLPLGTFEAILLEYVSKYAEGNAMSEAIETRWSAWEAETGRCYQCCSHGPDAEERCKPICRRCGGTGVARRSMKSLDAQVRALIEALNLLGYHALDGTVHCWCTLPPRARGSHEEWCVKAHIAIGMSDPNQGA